MSRHAWIPVILLALIAGGKVAAGEPCCCEPVARCQPWQLRPAGGWFPYGGFMKWWNRCWFPRGGGPDDYCRKPLPPFGWPPYPPYYKLVPYGCSCPPAEGGCRISVTPRFPVSPE